MIATTLNIHIDVLSKIAETALMFRKSRSEIIIMLLMRVMNNPDSFKHRFTTVTYQKKDTKKNWRCFHIKMKENEYEYFIDLRKLCKFSVSCLVAIAVMKYLPELIRDLEGKGDNYIYFMHYVLHGEEIEGVISHSFYWGLPIEHLKSHILIDESPILHEYDTKDTQ